MNYEKLTVTGPGGDFNVYREVDINGQVTMHYAEDGSPLWREIPTGSPSFVADGNPARLGWMV